MWWKLLGMGTALIKFDLPAFWTKKNLYQFARKLFRIVLLITISFSIPLESIRAIENTALTENQPLTIVVQEIQESKKLIMPIFKFEKGTWNSTQKNDVFLEFFKGKPSFYELESSMKDNPINLKDYTLLKSTAFEGWVGEKRVDVYTSIPLKNNSSKWVERKPTPEILSQAIQKFKVQYPNIKYSWAPKDVKVTSSYISPEGQWIIGLIMNGKFNDALPEDEFVENCFFLENNKVRFLGTYLHPLIDFTYNDQTIWLMGYAGYNEDGYVLWDNNFKTKQVFTYSYH